ncbi:MAG: hypothetical protein DRI69_02480 [Bacteroidetes bacterium]|nr:MAG: hypothetical protein DRI69_02480 [Bacteroidota bacterium]
MRQCSTCGNEIQDSATICPFCDSSQEPVQIIRKKVAIRVSVIKLKENSPTVDEAMQRLTAGLVAARKRNIKVIKIIHGYGSTGVGGAIKIALLGRLQMLKEEAHIKTFITGEEHNTFAGSRNYLLNKYPELKETWIEDRGNPGITFIEL